jgi:hypothetical protein
MASPLVYLDTSDVAEGSLRQLKDAIAELAGFVEAHEPELLAYQVYFSDDGKRMSILHVHRDARSLVPSCGPHGFQSGRFISRWDPG